MVPEKQYDMTKSLILRWWGWLFIGIIAGLTPGWSASLPIKVRIGTPQWQSATHAVVPLFVHIEAGWKLYGPSQTDDTLKRPPEFSWDRSSNISALSPQWPQPQFWADQDQKAHVYYDTVSVPLDVFLQDRKPASLVLKLEGLCCSELCVPFSVEGSLTLTPPSIHWMSWIKMLFFAFLGGVILNLMPCVLPVLGLKLKGLTQNPLISFRQSCFATFSGIMSGFWSLGGLIIVMKTVFHQHLSWGAQLQNPLFLCAMILIMVACAYGLMGLFHLRAPQWALTQAGRSELSSRPALQAFVFGLLAVLLATPCSAPFLGPALGFALTGSPFEIITFYTAIGLGFGLPYLIGIVAPIDRYLPKPGAWMIWVEYLMGILFMLSAAWLIGWPLSAFLSPWGQKIAWSLFGIWCVIPLAQKWKSSWTVLTQSLIFYGIPLTLGVGLFFLPSSHQEGTQVSMKDGKIHWLAWSPQRMREAMQADRIVIIDVTGRGCALCMVNKRIFHNPSVQEALTKPNIVCLRADYSRGSPEILLFLKQYGRAAIPFNLVISQAYPKGIILSEILTEAELLNTLKILQKIKKAPQLPH